MRAARPLRGVAKFGCRRRDRRSGNKAGINDSIEERHAALLRNERRAFRTKRAAAGVCKHAPDRNGPRGSDCIAKAPSTSRLDRWARGLRGNMTQIAKSASRPDAPVVARYVGRHRPAPRGRAWVSAYFLEKLIDAR